MNFNLANLLSQSGPAPELTNLEKQLKELNQSLHTLDKEQEILSISTKNLDLINQEEENNKKQLENLSKKKSLVLEYKNKNENNPAVLDSLMLKLAELDKEEAALKEKSAQIKQEKEKVDNDLKNAMKGVEGKLQQMLEEMDVLETKSVIVVQKRITEQVIKLEKQAQNLDLCFLLDATGSMDPYIVTVKERIQDIIEAVKQRFGSLSFRVAIVGYRDFFTEASEHKNPRFEIFNFNPDLQLFTDFLNNLEAIGGNDAAEDVNGGLQKAIYALDWKNPTKTIIHIADAPCHGTKFHNVEEEYDGYDDNYPNGLADDVPFEQLFTDIKKKGISYMFMEVCEDTKTMVSEFKKIYDACPQGNPNSRFDSAEISNAPKTQEERKKEAEALVSAITQTVNNSLNLSVSNNSKILSQSQVHGRKRPTKINVDDINPQEHNIPFKLSEKIDFALDRELTVHVKATITCIENIIDPKELETENFKLLRESAKISVAKDPFTTSPRFFDEDPVLANQAFLIYYGTFTPANSSREYKMVLRRRKAPADPYFYAMSLKKNIFASYLAHCYNDALKKAGFGPKERVYVSRLFAVAQGKNYYLMEPFIEGQFYKYVDKEGTVNEAVPIMSAFSHFTYEFTQEKFMVTDLKGHGNILSNPEMFSRYAEFQGCNDKGESGMILFFRHHECNDYCKKLGLQPKEWQQMRDFNVEKYIIPFDLEKGTNKCSSYYCNKNAESLSFCNYCRPSV